MRILLDPQIFIKQPFGGISRYFTEIYRLFSEGDKGIKVKLPLYISDNLHLKSYDLQPKIAVPFPSSNFRIVNSALHRTRNFLAQKSKHSVRSILLKGEADIFIPTYYDNYFLSELGSTPFVLTVFDMIHELFPQYKLFNADPSAMNKKMLMEQATRIIAISENTKKDIINFYPHIAAEKIDVVYLSHSINLLSLSKPKESKLSDYLLFVGHRGAYKNFIFLIKTISTWLMKNNIKLICLGGGALNHEELSLIDLLNVKDSVSQISFEDHQLGNFYANARAFIFPSEYEGFGIPILEAMACGCPVILPYASSFPEVAEEAGVYFKLNDGASLLEVLDNVMFDETLRIEKIKAGYIQVQKFSWQNTMNKCLNVYQKAIG